MKLDIYEFYSWCAEAKEDQLILAKGKLLAEKNCAEKMIWAVDRRLEYLSKITPENVFKHA